MVRPTALSHLDQPQVKDSEVPLHRLWQVLGPRQLWREGELAAEKRKVCWSSAKILEPADKEDPGVPTGSLRPWSRMIRQGHGLYGKELGSSPGSCGPQRGVKAEEGKQKALRHKVWRRG